MARAVLISIRPEWVKMILNGEKTLEIRKTCPKLETPFKVYIYCTAGNLSYEVNEGMMCNISGGKLVVGEFIVDTFVTDRTLGHDELFYSAACMKKTDMEKYSAGKTLYGWHISNLEIYDTPKKLSEFSRPFENCIGKVCDEYGCAYCENGGHIKRPPQSWCYVEGLP